MIRVAHALFLSLPGPGRLLLLLLGRLRLIVHGGLLRSGSVFLPSVAILDGWRVCPRCGGRLRHEQGRVECGACSFVFYANPKPTACALVVDDEGRILLVRRATEVENGKWDLPGGYLEEGEHPEDAVVREVREETGLEIEVGELYGVWMDWYGDAPDAASTMNLYWLARAVGGEPSAADDVDALAWFAPDELPPDDEIAFENVPLVLHAWRKHSR